MAGKPVFFCLDAGLHQANNKGVCDSMIFYLCCTMQSYCHLRGLPRPRRGKERNQNGISRNTPEIIWNN